MRLKHLTFVFALLFVFGTMLVYYQKISAAELERDYRKVVRQINQERKSLRILQAEWGHLTRPAYVKRWRKQRPELSPITPEQVVSESDLERIAKFHSYESADSKRERARNYFVQGQSEISNSNLETVYSDE